VDMHPMPDEALTRRWLAAFPDLPELEPEHRGEMLGSIRFNRLNEGDIAYRQGQHCHAYVMCIAGRTRVFKTSESGARSCFTRSVPARPAC